MGDNTATLTWLVIIALSSVTQTIVLVGALVVLYRRWRAAEERLRDIERAHVAPALARLELALQDLQDVAARFRRADEAVHRWADRTADGVETAMGLVWSRARPVLGLVKGVRAAARAWSQRAAHKSRGGPTGPEAVRRDAGRR